ncbi:DUF5713 family protein [Stenotrophomonas sp.]|uniref:DUF5713 family protein n=1 Tax=Stenotrophomonas sp. TaxID=69392 RepID=UPI002FCCB046
MTTAPPAISNATLQSHVFLADMLQDAYFPPALVAKGQQILLRLCHRIERDRPADGPALMSLTHAATLEFNVLGEAFEAQDSELETAARDNIGADFELIARSYGFDVDVEALISPREW